MAISLEEIQKKLDSLKENYTKKLPEKLETLDRCWAKIIEQKAETDDYNLFYNVAHKLAGSATTFGFPEVSQICNQLQVDAQNLIEKKIPLTNETKSRISGLLEYLKLKALKSNLQEAISQPFLDLNSSFKENRQKKVIVVDDDTTLLANTALHLEAVGITVIALDKIEDLESVIQKEKPDLLIVDLSFPKGRFAGAEEVNRIKKSTPDIPPCLFMSANSTTDYRLASLRAGGRVHLVKPFAVDDLIAVIQQILCQQQSVWTVLIVDDDEALASQYKTLLKKNGFIVRVVCDSTQVLDQMSEHKPDLVLLDLHMPQVTGDELAGLIRQIDLFVATPIIFLSSEQDATKREEILRRGAEDFFDKTGSFENLLDLINRRLIRFSQMNHLIDHDVLTKLLNRRAFLARLEQEIVRARRHNESFVYALLDLDSFKSINDNYGHSIGDQVLQRLASLLENNFRRSDIIARIGGDEFVVVCPQSGTDDVLQKMDQVRSLFQNEQFFCGSENFTCTFSCGLAEFPLKNTASELLQAADAAVLKISKDSGKNKISTFKGNPL